MRAILIALLVLLSSCDSGNNFVPNLTITTGYTSGLSQDTIYIPRYIPAGDDWRNYDQEFAVLGHSLREWLGLIRRESYSRASTQDQHQEYPLLVHVQFTKKEDLPMYCHTQYANACTDINNLPECTIYIPQDGSDALFGHELWHCVAGRFHS